MKHFKFTIRGHVYEVDILDFEGNQAKLEVNGTPYSVEIEHERQTSKTPVLVRKEVKLPRGAHKIQKDKSTVYKVKAPLPGNIMQLLIKEGDTVEKGDKLLIYEAMKMENTVTAEKEGTISKIRVSPGDSVLQDDVLLEIN